MRSREMNNKLDRLAPSSEDDEHAIPDLTLLSPELQDWVDEMFEKIRASEDGPENVITEAEARKLIELLNGLPVLGRDDKFAGPDLDIPREIEEHFTLAKWHEDGRHHWPSFDFFRRLKAVQTVRFVELCRKYGWEGEYPDPDRGRGRKRHWAHRDPVRLLPLNQWDSEDEAELRSLLDLAEV
jgi:hypothetical protein